MNRAFDRLARSEGYHWLVLFLMSFALIVDGVTRQGFFSLSPLFQADLGLSRSQVGLLNSALAIGSLLILMPAGWLSDRFGSRIMALLGVGATGLFFAAVSLTKSFPMAWLALLLAGLGHGFINPATTRAVMWWAPARIRGTAMGIKQMGFPLGGALAGSILPGLALRLGWRTSIALAGMAQIVVAIVTFALYRDRPSSQAGSSGAVKAGISYRNILAVPGVQILGFMAFTFTLVNQTIATYLVLYLTESLAYPLVIAGGYFALTQGAGAFGRVFWGVASDRVFRGRRKPILVFAGLTSTLTTAIIGLAAPYLPSWAVGGLVFLLGGTIMGYSGIWMALLGELVGPQAIGRAAGYNIFLSNIGVLVGPPIFGYLVDSTGSYTVGWLFLALVAALATAVILSQLTESRAIPVATQSSSPDEGPI